MPTGFAKAAPNHEVLRRTLRSLLGGLAIAGAAAVLNVSTAAAAETFVAVPAFGQAGNGSSWGAGPVMVSLVAIARQTRPIAGIEPAALRSGGIRPTSLRLPVRGPALGAPIYDAQEGPLPSGGGLKLIPASFHR